MTIDASGLDTCGCCEGLEEPAMPKNAPGLPSIGYRVDTQPGFYRRMLESLPLARRDRESPDAQHPLARLLTRASDDPTVALVDAAACVADVLTFYGERIANEGFLRTATERRSVLELARAIGYELKPGVAASVHLAFTVEDAPGAPQVATIPQGTAIQSVPAQGQIPQVFETSAAIVARAEWNALVPRLTRPADMAVLETATNGKTTRVLALLGPAGSFPPLTVGLHANLDSAGLFRLDPSLTIEASVDALEVGRIYVAEGVSGIEGGDLLLFVGKNGADLRTLVLSVSAVSPEPELKRIRIDLEPLPEPVPDPPAPRIATWLVPYTLRPVVNLAKPQMATVPFTSASIAGTISARSWRESDLQAMIGMQRWDAGALSDAIAGARPSGPPPSPEVGAFAFVSTLGFFGNNAPRWKLLPDGTTAIHGNAYPTGWDKGDTIDGGGTLPRTIWETSQGCRTTPLVHLERAVADVVRGSWAVFDAPDVVAEAFTVLDARETSIADFGISGRGMQVRVADANGNPLPTSPPNFRFRTATAHVASRRLDLAELPIDAPIAARDTAIELDRMVLGLSVGQPVALTGERYDVAGVDAAEIAILADIVHTDGRTTLVFEDELENSYVRASLRISANVVHATHGETAREVLGSGDASVPNQRFTLKKPPTTYLPAKGGAASTLQVRVAGVLWDERSSLYGARADETVYTSRFADNGTTTVIFGNGIEGARLPTGTLNVAAHYRSGIGPEGEVAAGALTMLRAIPLGVRGVTNPLPASGAEGPERLDDARRNAPLTLLTFDRVVSLLDYEDYARAFPGIGKARGDVLWVDGASRVFLTVAGATGGPPGEDILEKLAVSIAAASDPAQRFDAAPFAPRFFSVKASVAVHRRYVVREVIESVAAALRNAFVFKARDIGQSVTAAEIMALIHRVEGVVAVDLDELVPSAGTTVTPSDPAATAVPAFAARWDAAARAAMPAELLLINPAGIVIKEMAS
ncbi:hypothetical protein [Azospirillum picis]|uniref:Phage baseplate assembly protein n=1 Tax=Azospirillum picis TaxID=488438 RepID=A0ABU0MSU8_9PROT|nr:hypothetical protein [Azospirillum picis]MBP2302793.1 putative phage baseplate assembly protein [Azospirillum picis]MDQ0536545.1 putative phage baseplate assembly protein [Azospirillum picis]